MIVSTLICGVMVFITLYNLGERNYLKNSGFTTIKDLFDADFNFDTNSFKMRKRFDPIYLTSDSGVFFDMKMKLQSPLLQVAEEIFIDSIIAFAAPVAIIENWKFVKKMDNLKSASKKFCRFRKEITVYWG